MTGKTLNQLTEMLRAEIGASTAVAMGTGSLPMLHQLLRRTQETLYLDHNWSHLRIERDEAPLAGERYYTFNADVDFTRITAAWVRHSGQWQPVGYGFDPMALNAVDSDADSRQDPVRVWRHHEGNQFEVWPVPASAQTLRFRGVKALGPLVANTDTADLDDNLIVLFAAADLLAQQRSEAAALKLQKAMAQLNRLKARGQKTDIFVMGGGLPQSQRGIQLAQGGRA